MKSIKRIHIILIIQAILFSAYTTHAQEQVQEKPWSGTLRDKSKIDQQDLYKILEDHKQWLNTKEMLGRRAILQRANLSRANLQKANLNRAILQEANLAGANLKGTWLSNANLQNANLQVADLQNAVMLVSNLRMADLSSANLQRADLFRVDLQEARLVNTNLQATILDGGANLRKANLTRANLQKTEASNANLQEANLLRADLRKADLSKANLQMANLLEADLREANLEGADLGGAIFEIKPGCLPNIPSIAKARSLSLLIFRELPHSLVELRAAFNKSGYREQERKITFAIKHTQTLQLLGKNNETLDKTSKLSLKQIWGYISLILFEWTCDWGMSPGRPFMLLIIFIFPFSLFYMIALIFPKMNGDGIWKVWIKERANKKRGSDQNELLIISKGLEIWGYGLYFGLLSAFHMGWRDLNVGNWLARIHPREYTLRASGWVRMVSGIQSLISVYLLALSILTYFGRPFESY